MKPTEEQPNCEAQNDIPEASAEPHGRKGNQQQAHQHGPIAEVVAPQHEWVLPEEVDHQPEPHDGRRGEKQPRASDEGEEAADPDQEKVIGPEVVGVEADSGQGRGIRVGSIEGGAELGPRTAAGDGAKKVLDGSGNDVRGRYGYGYARVRRSGGLRLRLRLRHF